MTVAVTFLNGSPAFAQHERIRYAVTAEPRSLNPLFLGGGEFDLISQVVFEPLLRHGPDLRVVPALALQEPSVRNGISADGKHINYHLRHDTLWSDGSPVTSADVKFTLLEYLNPRNNISDFS